MKRIIVIGGGLAGISAAGFLGKNDFKITLIESSPHLGGRVKSFYDGDFNSYLDNGQHLLIKGYKTTLDLIRKFRAEDNFIFQNEFAIIFRDKNNKEWQLKISAPVKTLFNFLKFKNLNFKERISLLNFFLQLRNDYKITEDLSALDFLRKYNQNEKVINNFWKLIVESALNTPIEKASARVFLFVLKKMFVENKSNSSFVIPKKSLFESLILPAENFLNEKGVTIIKSCGVEKILINNDYVTEVVDKNGKIHKADYYILAIHPAIINKLIPQINFKLDYQSIINLHLKISYQGFENKFFALWDSIIHWAFFHKNHLTLIKSSADELLKYSNKEILQMFIDELIQFFPDLRNELTRIKSTKQDYRLIKEKRSTFLSDFNSTKVRPPFKTRFKNLFLAGDYVNTGYPSTIESAVLSGKLVAEEIQKIS